MIRTLIIVVLVGLFLWGALFSAYVWLLGDNIQIITENYIAFTPAPIQLIIYSVFIWLVIALLKSFTH